MQTPIWGNIAMTMPMWCGGCNRGQDGLCHPLCYAQRVITPSYQHLYAEMLLESPHEEPPCVWCGKGAADYCESCPRGRGPLSAMCFRCEKTLVQCRLCRAEAYVKGTLGTIRHPSISAWRQNQDGQGAYACAHCDRRGPMHKCTGCLCVRYCDGACQNLNWRCHKAMCLFLGRAVPVTFIYPWQSKRVTKLFIKAVRRGRCCEFYECFDEELLAKIANTP